MAGAAAAAGAPEVAASLERGERRPARGVGGGGDPAGAEARPLPGATPPRPLARDPRPSALKRATAARPLWGPASREPLPFSPSAGSLGGSRAAAEVR